VAERAASAAHMQLISGCSPAAYWGGHAVWDVATHAALSAVSIAIFAAFGDGATTGSIEKVQCDAPLQRPAVIVLLGPWQCCRCYRTAWDTTSQNDEALIP